MRTYCEQRQFYVGIDLHARQMYICVLDNGGEIRLHRNARACPEALDRALAQFGTDLVVAAECMFSWYWVADFCAARGIEFVLGHALYMKAIHGTKTKNDRIDSKKIAQLLRGGMFPMAYVYPKELRATRDLLRRRQYFVHQQAELLAHIRNTSTQYNLEAYEKSLKAGVNRREVLERFEDEMVQASVSADVAMVEHYEGVMNEIEKRIEREARVDDPRSVALLKTVPGIGKILALVIVYEINDIARFPTVGQFLSYARLVKCPHESAGKRSGGARNKVGNSHLKWAFSEAAVLFLRRDERAKRLHQRLVSRYGKAKGLSVLAQKIGRSVYGMLKRKEAFNREKFFGDGGT